MVADDISVNKSELIGPLGIDDVITIAVAVVVVVPVVVVKAAIEDS